jgi:hypothetical protein
MGDLVTLFLPLAPSGLGESRASHWFMVSMKSLFVACFLDITYTSVNSPMNEFSVVDPLVYMRDLFPVGILTQQEDSCKTRLERSDS